MSYYSEIAPPSEEFSLPIDGITPTAIVAKGAKAIEHFFGHTS